MASNPGPTEIRLAAEASRAQIAASTARYEWIAALYEQIAALYELDAAERDIARRIAPKGGTGNAEDKLLR